jgi:hypothetical protein
MPSEKLVPVDEDLYNELQDAYQDLEQDIIRATGLEYGNEGVDPSVAEQVLLTIDKILTAYDYYATPEGEAESPKPIAFKPKRKKQVDVSGKVKV